MRYIFLFGLAAVISGCASRNVNWDYNPSVSLGSLKYYAWYPGEKTSVESGYDADALTQKRITSAVTRTLRSKGFIEIPTNDISTERGRMADFYIHATYRISPRLQAIQTSNCLDCGFYYPSYPWGANVYSTTNFRPYNEGTLTLDVINPRNKQVIWSGSSWARISKTASPMERTDQIKAAVKKILSGFPRPNKSYYDDDDDF
ncbi:DUF4136 domain-containing protein [Parendozoicomonas haliclonae]|uniref:DUF4136 domain-containing protein n=1 Tax=Parendozoicomonas haliclonae TaxID=1960125 RepID=A0A1X7AP27_9GAMM|nr:DUF4136 domain-containing protein [Parendozoicomonas haliclonae]SMA49839.1 hypothetical protein EHSB41UT_03629 [Parendozoicomonas haliclonae]